MTLYTLEHPATLLPGRNPELRDVFDTDFRRIVKLLSGWEPRYHDQFEVATSRQHIVKWFDDTPDDCRIALDLETSHDIVDMVGLASSAERALLVPIPEAPCDDDEMFAGLKDYLKGRSLIVHYAEGLEVEWLNAIGVLRQVTVHDLHKLLHAYDTEYANASESGSGSLAFIQSLFSWRPYHKHLLAQAEKTRDFQLKAHYCMLDSVVEWECFHRIEAACRREVPRAWGAYERHALPLLPILVGSRLMGWRVDEETFTNRRQTLQAEAKVRAEKVISVCGPSVAPKSKKAKTLIGSTALKKYLIAAGIKLPKTRKGNPMLDRKSRQKLFVTYPQLTLVEEYFETQDTLSDFYKKGIISKDGRCHAHASGFEASWRWRYTKPNLTQWPPKERVVFIADPGHILVQLDTSAGEYRYFAGLTHDPRLVQMFAEYDRTGAAESHPHVINAAVLFETSPQDAAAWKDDQHPEHRRYVFAKNYIYRLMYSYKGGVDALRDAAAKSGLEFSRDDIRAFDQQWFMEFPVAADWRKRQVQHARETRAVWNDEWGYLRKLHGVGKDLDNVALNHQTQAGIAGIINETIIVAYQRLGLLPLVNMHDGIVYQIRDDDTKASILHQLRTLATHTIGGVCIPVEVKVGTAWGQLTEFSDSTAMLIEALGRA